MVLNNCRERYIRSEKSRSHSVHFYKVESVSIIRIQWRDSEGIRVVWLNTLATFVFSSIHVRILNKFLINNADFPPFLAVY